jgi:hypothetical protein
MGISLGAPIRKGGTGRGRTGSKPNRINAGQKGLCLSHRNWFLFNARIFARSWFAEYTFDQLENA